MKQKGSGYSPPVRVVSCGCRIKPHRRSLQPHLVLQPPVYACTGAADTPAAAPPASADTNDVAINIFTVPERTQGQRRHLCGRRGTPAALSGPTDRQVFAWKLTGRRMGRLVGELRTCSAHLVSVNVVNDICGRAAVKWGTA
eukprot:GHVU01005336.1.p1 GENE.GHVU01005336.1~~GHVU01005336.1.p1  ORF type:complete len:142 (-),score=2.10 GHVU01005336.1:1189-1614(-)